MFVYKIKSRKTGLYSAGGASPEFNKNGKVWKNIGYLKNHLIYAYGRDLYRNQDCVIVTYEITEVVVEEQTCDELIVKQLVERADKESARKLQIDARLKKERQQQYEQLKKEFG